MGKKLTHEEYLIKFNNLSKPTDDYEVRCIYENSQKKLKYYHKICDNEFEMNPANFDNGQRCPICAKEKITLKAVDNIINYFNENNIEFESEVKLKGLINPLTNKSLRIDFYLPDYDLYIEYDGKQHFKFETSGYFNKEKFKEIKFRDKLKDDYFFNFK